MIKQSDPSKKDLPWRCVAGVFAFQLVALAVAGWIFRHALNPDGIAYLRIASYYAEGKIPLAISGYWSPLISWVLLPFLKLGVPPLVSARIVMGLSAVFFLCGCRQIFLKFQLPSRLVLLGLWVSALVSIPWSVENITPDLLLVGLVCFAFAPMVTPDFFNKPGVTGFAGMLWGGAFLCKSIALPVGVLTTLAMAFLWWTKSPVARPKILTGLAMAWLGIGLVSVPWVGIMSRHYGKFTVANSAGLNHSLVGPDVTNRLYLLDHGFRAPEPGRITVWEDPSLPYPDWSPLASGRNAWHQIRIVVRNLPGAVMMLTGISLTVPVLILMALWRPLRKRIAKSGEPNAWWALVPILLLAGFYLPNYLLLNEQRYFYVAFPLLFAVSARWLSGDPGLPVPALRRYGPVMLAACFLIPTAARFGWRPKSTREAGEVAQVLAGKISHVGLAGPVAGSGRLAGGRAGLYTAYLLNQPWLGDEPSARAADFKRCGASLVVVRRGTSLAEELVAAGFQNLDSKLFDGDSEAGKFPLQVFKPVASGNSPPD